MIDPLIEPEWNVNSLISKAISIRVNPLIEPEWNVNYFTSIKKEPVGSLLIEPEWNVNPDSVRNTIAKDSSFNRSIM